MKFSLVNIWEVFVIDELTKCKSCFVIALFACLCCKNVNIKYASFVHWGENYSIATTLDVAFLLSDCFTSTENPL